MTAVTGVRLAVDPGQGRSAVPVRSALAGLALSAAAVAAAVTFGANLLHLVQTPAAVRPGLGSRGGPAVLAPSRRQQFDKITAGVPGISGWTFGLHGTVAIGDAVIPAIGLAPGPGPLMPRPCWPAARRGSASTRSCSAPRCSGGSGLRIGQPVPVTAAGRKQQRQ